MPELVPVDHDPFVPPNPSLSGRTAGQTYDTKLDPGEEQFFRQWVAQNNVPFDPNATAPQDYDMRGFYKGILQQNPKAQSAVDPNDARLHYPDYWKTPTHETFSNESQWAPANAPAWNDQDQLVSQGGRVVFDDRKRRDITPAQDVPLSVSLVPVDHDPFAARSLIPVDHNPFSAEDMALQARAQLASQPERLREPELSAAAGIALPPAIAAEYEQMKASQPQPDYAAGLGLH